MTKESKSKSNVFIKRRGGGEFLGTMRCLAVKRNVWQWRETDIFYNSRKRHKRFFAVSNDVYTKPYKVLAIDGSHHFIIIFLLRRTDYKFSQLAKKDCRNARQTMKTIKFVLKEKIRKMDNFINYVSVSSIRFR